MLKTVELDTLKICDRLFAATTKLRIAALAVEGLEDDQGEGDNVAIASMILDVVSDLREVGDTIHPPLPDEEIAHIKRESERRIAEWADSGTEEVRS